MSKKLIKELFEEYERNQKTYVEKNERVLRLETELAKLIQIRPGFEKAYKDAEMEYGTLSARFDIGEASEPELETARKKKDSAQEDLQGYSRKADGFENLISDAKADITAFNGVLEASRIAPWPLIVDELKRDIAKTGEQFARLYAAEGIALDRLIHRDTFFETYIPMPKTGECVRKICDELQKEFLKR